MNEMVIVVDPKAQGVSFEKERNVLTVPPSLEKVCRVVLSDREGIKDLVSFLSILGAPSSEKGKLKQKLSGESPQETTA